MPVFTNISAYKFTPLSDLKTLRTRLLALCGEARLKGTILLSTEGINLFVAGPRPAIDRLVAELHGLPGLADLAPKFSESAEQPFNRMLVRIKKEIIAFGVEGIDPARHPSPKLSPRTLKRWLDEGRPVTLLDTRNDYEVKLGTFKGAVVPGITHFRDFPAAVRKLPADLKDRPVVMFCTGGIRCEKAGPFMEREGFRDIHQLDGGILKYFEECGGAHYDGECFVFDQRVGVDPALRETPSAQCFQCQTPLTAEEQRHPRYQPPHACPYCYKSDDEQLAVTLARRHDALRRAATPLPGLQPYDNERPLLVPAHHDGARLIDFLCAILGQVPRQDWQTACDAGRIRDQRRQPLAADHRVRVGDRYLHLRPASVEPAVNADIRVLHEDDALVVLAKPAPLPMHAAGRFNRHTLDYFLKQAYRPWHPKPAHRLDANTTGVVVCARTRQISGLLQPQFARGEVDKTYLVRIRGNPPADAFSCDAPISDEPGPTGTRTTVAPDSGGLEARTYFSVRSRSADGTTLLEARPLTGRTNQIRVHLWHLGLPVCGDPSYLAGGLLGDSQTLPLDAPPLCLHAWQISLTHPGTGRPVTFTAEPPAWARD